MNSFETAIVQLLENTLSELITPNSFTAEKISPLLEQPPNPEMGDYAMPCFQLAKLLRNNPKVIAQNLAETLQAKLEQVPELQAVKAIGPYLNFHVSIAQMAAKTLPAMHQGSYFERNRQQPGPRVMVEFSQPNTHKGFHVGHMRNVALGDSLCRIFRYNGYDVTAANYIGDVGAHIAKCLWYYLDFNQDPPPASLKGEWLGTLYMKATLKLEDATPEEAAQYQARISSILAALEAKQPDILETWTLTRDWSLKDFNEIYHWLDVHFDHVFYESEVDDAGKQLVLQAHEKGTFIQSEGAIGIDLNDADLGFFMLLKSDGNTLYSTKDLALAQKKFEKFGIEESLYVVGAEQTLHFKQVFETLKRMGYAQAERCKHLAYALVMVPEGKMSSRAGNVILFSQLRNEMSQYIQTNFLNSYRGQWEDSEIEETTRRVAVAAIKYGMLSQDPAKQIVFSLNDWLVSEGDTGTYLIYAYVRIRSIVRQVQLPIQAEVDFSLLNHPNEQVLIRALFDFNSKVVIASEQYRPSVIARTAFELAKAFSRTYNTCSVKYAESEALKQARLLLFHCVAETLKQALNLLGIEPPERM